MHDFKQVRTHRQLLKRAADDSSDNQKDVEESTTAKSATTTSTSTSSKATSTTSSSSSTSSTTAAATTHTTSSTTSTTSQSTSTISTSSTTSSSTTALINISIGISSSTSSSSTSTTTTTTSSINAPVPLTTSTTPSSTHNPTTSFVTLTSSTSNGSAASATSSEKASTTGGLSSAAKDGIIAFSVLAGLIVIIFAVRKTFIQRRKRKRNTWGAGTYPEFTDKYSDTGSGVDFSPPLPEKPISNGYLNAEPQRMPVWAPPRPVSPNPSLSPSPSSYYIPPPQASYNNAPSIGVPMGPATPRPASSAAETAVVRVVFIPTLPDELSISAGEIVTVVKAFDDGWALCQNIAGEQGVVPTECLDRSASPAQADTLSIGKAQHDSGSDWRNMKRISSLSQQQHY